MAEEDDTLGVTFGPRARYSDYVIGDVVLYRRTDGSTRTGEISWTEPATTEHPLIYWIGLEALYATDIVRAVSTHAHVEEQQEGA